MEKVFRISIKKILRFSISIGVGLFILFLIIAVIGFFSNGFSFKALLEGVLISIILPLSVTILLTLLVFCLGFLFPIKVYSDRISATNYWGKRLIFNWKELESAESADASGVPYLVFSNKTDKKIWIPLLIGDLDSFIDCVSEKTKSQNPYFHKKFNDLVYDKEIET